MIRAGFTPEHLIQPLFGPIRPGETREFNGCKIICRGKVVAEYSHVISPRYAEPAARLCLGDIISLQVKRNINMTQHEAEYWKEERAHRIKKLRLSMAFKFGDVFTHRTPEDAVEMIGFEILDRIEKRRCRCAY